MFWTLHTRDNPRQCPVILFGYCTLDRPGLYRCNDRLLATADVSPQRPDSSYFLSPLYMFINHYPLSTLVPSTLSQ